MYTTKPIFRPSHVVPEGTYITPVTSGPVLGPSPDNGAHVMGGDLPVRMLAKLGDGTHRVEVEDAIGRRFYIPRDFLREAVQS